MKKLSYIDTSSCLRGLLILIKKDNIIHENEVELLKKISKDLGLEKEYYEKVVEELLQNKVIDTSPPKFSSKRTSMKFILEAIQMAFIDNHFHIKELTWLNEVAKKNRIPKRKVTEKIKEYVEKHPERAKQIILK